LRVYIVVLLLTDVGRGFFGQGEMQKEFEDASFKLEPGQTSGIIETASGVHLIQRLE
jgi:NIMA-interacting peptidyl-prolyl cis-trans isomerase 1